MNSGTASTAATNSPMIQSTYLADAAADHFALVRGSDAGGVFKAGATASDNDYLLQWADGTRVNSVVLHDYHPMYSTATPATRNFNAAHTGNISFADEIGHFDHCTQIDQEGGSCIGREGVAGDREPADADDNGCFSPALSFLV